MQNEQETNTTKQQPQQTHQKQENEKRKTKNRITHTMQQNKKQKCKNTQKQKTKNPSKQHKQRTKKHNIPPRQSHSHTATHYKTWQNKSTPRKHQKTTQKR